MSYTDSNRYSSFEPNTSYQGKTFFVGNVSNPKTCQQMCVNNPKCAGWSFNNTNKECQLKDQISNKVNSIFMVGGTISDNNNILNNNMPVTNNRFNNNNQNKNILHSNPYYVSGVPIGNSSNVSTVSTDNSTPYNGVLIQPQQINQSQQYQHLPQYQLAQQIKQVFSQQN